MNTVAEHLVRQLTAWGVERLYGVVGDTFLPLLDAIAKEERLRFIPVRHEAAAGFMASAEAKLTGNLTACVATSGPGIANLVNGLGDAWADGAPVLAITGQVERWKIGTHAKQYVDQQALLRPLPTFSALVTDLGAMAPLLAEAMRTAVAERQVAHLSVPKDLFTEPCPGTVTPPEPYLGAVPALDQSQVDGALRLMATAQQPLILAGVGARAASADLARLAERWGAGVILSLPARGSLPWSNPFLLGGLGDGGSDAAHIALGEADMLFVAGCNWWPSGYVPEGVPVVKLDRIPLNAGGPMQVRYGLVGDVRAALPALLAGMGQASRSQWLQRLAGLKRDWEQRLEAEAATAEPVLTPQHLVREVERAIPADAIIALDTGDHTVWFSRVFGGAHHQVLLSGKWRSLGFGVPAAAAAKLAAPDRTVVALVGDGGLQSLMSELVTLAEQRLPVPVILFNNGMMAIERNRALARGFNTLGTVPMTPDFTELARACGLQSIRVRSAPELKEALAEALAAGVPTLVDVSVSAPVAPTAAPPVTPAAVHG